MRDLSTLCERARKCVSLRVDDELSELETALLEAHLLRCAGCRQFACETAAFTIALRSQPLETPQTIVMPLRRRRARVRTFEVAAAAAVVAAVGVASLAGSLGTSERAPQFDLRTAPARAQQDDMVELTSVRRGHLLGMTSRSWVPRRGFRIT